MKLGLYLPLILITIFAVILIILYFSEKPIDRPSSIVEFPYIVSVKPAVITIGESATIRVSILNGTTPNSQNYSLFVVAPDGSRLTPKDDVTDLSQVRFPRDFRPIHAGQLGSYAIIFVPNDATDSVVRLDFDSASNSFLNELFDFVFGYGLIAAFGLVGSVITFLYQIASTRKSDSERIKSEKAKWITENMRNYISLADQDADVYKKVKAKLKSSRPFTQSEADKILCGMILYYGDYLEFLKKPGLYYFDDYTLENFLLASGVAILNTFEEIIGDPTEELGLLKGKRFNELLIEQDFIRYSGKVLTWLNISGNPYRLYLNHLIHHHVLLVGINKALLDTYSNTKKLRNDLEKSVSVYRLDLESGIKNLCKAEFNDESYFKLFNKKDKLDL